MKLTFPIRVNRCTTGIHSGFGLQSIAFVSEHSL